jgi:hypothetical protein
MPQACGGRIMGHQQHPLVVMKSVSEEHLLGHKPPMGEFIPEVILRILKNAPKEYRQENE